MRGWEPWRLPDLISLLHRADWTRLCLSAEVSDRSTLLIAPGKRYLRCHSPGRGAGAH
jgi:hypothetical protein